MKQFDIFVGKSWSSNCSKSPPNNLSRENFRANLYTLWRSREYMYQLLFRENSGILLFFYLLVSLNREWSITFILISKNRGAKLFLEASKHEAFFMIHKLTSFRNTTFWESNGTCRRKKRWNWKWSVLRWKLYTKLTHHRYKILDCLMSQQTKLSHFQAIKALEKIRQTIAGLLHEVKSEIERLR